MNLLKVFISCLLFSSISFNGIAQYGYLGKTTQLSISFLANTPVFSGNFKEKNYYLSGDEFKERRDYLDYGLSVEYNKMLSPRIALGFEVTGKKFEVFGDRYLEDYFSSSITSVHANYITELKVNSANIINISLIPEVVITPKANNSTAGITHKIGVGFSMSTLIHKYYNYSLNEFSNSDNKDAAWTAPDKYYLHNNYKPFTALTLMYGLHFAVPISQFIHYKVGFSYYFNFYGLPSNNTFLETDNEIFDYEIIFENVKRENLFNWNLNTGLIFILN